MVNMFGGHDQTLLLTILAEWMRPQVRVADAAWLEPVPVVPSTGWRRPGIRLPRLLRAMGLRLVRHGVDVLIGFVL